MRRVAHARALDPNVRQKAVSILNAYNVKSNDYVNEAYAIGDWVKTHIPYVKDAANAEQLFDPVMLLDQERRGEARGDCDDMSMLIATLLLSIGHNPYFRAIRYSNNSGPYSHIYVVCYEKTANGIDEERVVLDAIIKDKPIGYEIPQQSGDEYQV